MQFAHSIWLLAGVAACGILALSFYRFQKKSAAALKEFASERLLEKLTRGVSPKKRLIKRVILILAVGLIFVALARPQVGYEWKEVKRKGIDILMAVDTSKSMLAEDVRPNRLERSKFGIMDFISKLEGDRVGLLPFAGSAFLMCPLTLDYDAFSNSLEALDTNIIPQGGTDIASAIYEAEAAFNNDANHKILVLVTDGEDLEGEALSAARAAKQRGLTIYTVGVGTPSGELIPLVHGGKDGAFVKDEKGQPVKSRLDETMLQKIAEATGGRYEPLGQQAEGLETIYREKLSLVPKHELAEKMQRVPIERFQWPLMLALLLLVMEFAISDRKRKRKAFPVVTTAYRRIPKIGRAAGASSVLLLVLLAIVLLGYRSAHASPVDAEAAYKAGHYDAAVQEYRSEAEKAPEDPQLQFNLGAAAYKGKQYPIALASFNKSLKVQDIGLQNQSYYNIGNTLYRKGEGTEKQNPQQTIKDWEASIKAYENALKLKPDDKDAEFNRDFVKKRLEELKKNQQQNQNKDKKNDKDNQQANNKNSKQDPKKNDQEKKSGKNQKQDSPEKNSQQQNKKNQQEAKADLNKNNKPQAKRPEASDGSAKKEQMKNAEKQDQKNAAQASRKRRPGQMTEEQAKRLLDSLKGDENTMPMTAQNMGAGGKPEDQSRRDW
jgi:Ca-activated chloride channel family protein